MKRRVRKIVNFFAFNLLFFALYLNFIHNDKAAAAPVSENSQASNTAAFSGTVLVENPEQYLQKKTDVIVPAVQKATEETSTKTEETTGEPLKLSIN